jgi:hypothetical protein
MNGDWKPYSSPVELNRNVEVNVTTADGKRKARSLTVNYVKIHGSLN